MKIIDEKSFDQNDLDILNLFKFNEEFTQDIVNIRVNRLRIPRDGFQLKKSEIKKLNPKILRPIEPYIQALFDLHDVPYYWHDSLGWLILLGIFIKPDKEFFNSLELEFDKDSREVRILIKENLPLSELFERLRKDKKSEYDSLIKNLNRLPKSKIETVRATKFLGKSEGTKWKDILKEQKISLTEKSASEKKRSYKIKSKSLTKPLTLKRLSSKLKIQK